MFTVLIIFYPVFVVVIKPASSSPSPLSVSLAILAVVDCYYFRDTTGTTVKAAAIAVITSSSFLRTADGVVLANEDMSRSRCEFDHLLVF